MNLSEDQKEKVRAWAENGATLNDIQKRLKDELGIGMTYMDVRFLVSDLEIVLADAKAKAAADELKAKEAAEAEAAAEAAAEAGEVVEADAEVVDGAGGETLEEMLADDGGGNVTIVVDAITVPGAVVSGSVTFSDGKSAKWFLDQMGQLGFDPEEEGYRPSEADAMAFQRELQGALKQQGF